MPAQIGCQNRSGRTYVFVSHNRILKNDLRWRAQHAPRLRIIFGLAAGPHATCVIMAHGHDACTLRNSPLPRLNRIKDTMWYYFFLFIVCCRVAAACCVFSALYPIALGELLFSCFSAYPHSVPALCVLCVVHCSAYLFKKERKKREGKEE